MTLPQMGRDVFGSLFVGWLVNQVPAWLGITFGVIWTVFLGYEVVTSKWFVKAAWAHGRAPRMVIYGIAGVVGMVAAMGLVRLSEWIYERQSKSEEATTVRSFSANKSSEWARISDSDRTKLSLALSNGNYYKIEIYRIPTPDSIRLAEDFYVFLKQMQWTIPHRPSTSSFDIEPGIRVATVMDNVPSGEIKNIKERSGAILLIDALGRIGLPVTYEARSGTVDDLTLHLYIGVKPEN